MSNENIFESTSSNDSAEVKEGSQTASPSQGTTNASLHNEFSFFNNSLTSTGLNIDLKAINANLETFINNIPYLAKNNLLKGLKASIINIGSNETGLQYDLSYLYVKIDGVAIYYAIMNNSTISYSVGDLTTNSPNQPKLLTSVLNTLTPTSVQSIISNINSATAIFKQKIGAEIDPVVMAYKDFTGLQNIRTDEFIQNLVGDFIGSIIKYLGNVKKVNEFTGVNTSIYQLMKSFVPGTTTCVTSYNPVTATDRDGNSIRNVLTQTIQSRTVPAVNPAVQGGQKELLKTNVAIDSLPVTVTENNVQVVRFVPRLIMTGVSFPGSTMADIGSVFLAMATLSTIDRSTIGSVLMEMTNNPLQSPIGLDYYGNFLGGNKNAKKVSKDTLVEYVANMFNFNLVSRAIDIDEFSSTAEAMAPLTRLAKAVHTNNAAIVADENKNMHSVLNHLTGGLWKKQKYDEKTPNIVSEVGVMPKGRFTTRSGEVLSLDEAGIMAFLVTVYDDPKTIQPQIVGQILSALRGGIRSEHDLFYIAGVIQRVFKNTNDVVITGSKLRVTLDPNFMNNLTSAFQAIGFNPNVNTNFMVGMQSFMPHTDNFSVNGMAGAANQWGIPQSFGTTYRM